MAKPQYKRRNRERRARVIAENTAARAARTPAQQLARLDAAGHRALKERARLDFKINGIWAGNWSPTPELEAMRGTETESRSA